MHPIQKYVLYTEYARKIKKERDRRENPYSVSKPEETLS